MDQDRRGLFLLSSALFPQGASTRCFLLRLLCQARVRNIFSICSTVIGEPVSPDRHWRMPLATILKPGRVEGA